MLRWSEFWLSVTGGSVSFSDDRYTRVGIEVAAVGILLQLVPEAKAVKNRMHLDFQVEMLDAAVEACVAAGGIPLTRVAEYGIEWQVMADPDGNEFCLVGPPRG